MKVERGRNRKVAALPGHVSVLVDLDVDGIAELIKIRHGWLGCNILSGICLPNHVTYNQMWYILFVILSIGLILAALVVGLLPRKKPIVETQKVAVVNKQSSKEDGQHQRKEATKKVNHYDLGVLVIAKNEHMIVREFIEHYKQQGADHIYLIDNGSNDDMLDRIKDYIQSNYVSVHERPQKYMQASHYNDLFHKVLKHECEWVALVDIDEYAYGLEKPLRDVLMGPESNEIDYYHLPWTMYGSSGYDRQPDKIRESFVWRKQGKNPTTKAIFRSTAVTVLFIHDHTRTPEARYAFTPEDDAPIQLNHYAIMSREYFETTKMTRGAADNPAHDNVRDWDYFARYDSDMTRKDTRLADITINGYT